MKHKITSTSPLSFPSWSAYVLAKRDKDTLRQSAVQATVPFSFFTVLPRGYPDPAHPGILPDTFWALKPASGLRAAALAHTNSGPLARLKAGSHCRFYACGYGLWALALRVAMATRGRLPQRRFRKELSQLQLFSHKPRNRKRAVQSDGKKARKTRMRLVLHVLVQKRRKQCR